MAKQKFGKAALDEDVLAGLDIDLVPMTSVSEIDFRTAYYKSNLPLDTDFKAYQVRVDIISDVQDPSYYNTPAVRNIKAISFSRTV